MAEADLVPTDANLLEEYSTGAELVEACEQFMLEINQRPNRATRRPPVDMLVEEMLL